MKTIFQYKGKEYGYSTVDGEVIPFLIEKMLPEDDFELDEEMQQQLEAEFEVYEATLTAKEIKIWRGEG